MGLKAMMQQVLDLCCSQDVSQVSGKISFMCLMVFMSSHCRDLVVLCLQFFGIITVGLVT